MTILECSAETHGRLIRLQNDLGSVRLFVDGVLKAERRKGIGFRSRIETAVVTTGGDQPVRAEFDSIPWRLPCRLTVGGEDVPVHVVRDRRLAFLLGLFLSGLAIGLAAASAYFRSIGR